MMARAPDPGVAASLAAFSQSVGYLVSSAGPLEVGLLHTVTGSWSIPVTLLLVLCAVGLVAGVLAARPLVLPLPGPAQSPTRVSGTGAPR
jgi:CP family cyanate transporter-like MFS transporter